MRYDEARLLIADGDLVAVRAKHGFLTPFTRFFTRSGYTHTGIALWIDDGLWMAELNGGRNHLIPLSQLAGTDFDVYEAPVADRQAIRTAILESLRIMLDYSLLALFLIGLLNCLRIKVFLHVRRRLVCSGYCVSVYEGAGWPECSRLISPAELVAMLKLKLQIRS